VTLDPELLQAINADQDDFDYLNAELKDLHTDNTDLRTQLKALDGCPTKAEWEKLVQAEGELRTALAKAEERAEKAEADALWRRRENLRDKEQRDLAEAALVAAERDSKVTRLERDALRAEKSNLLRISQDKAQSIEALQAEVGRLKAERNEALKYLNGEGPSSHVPRIQLDRARAALAELEAQITSLTTELNHEIGKGDLLREELAEREAEIERLRTQSGLDRKSAEAFNAWFLDAAKERDEARASLAKAAEAAHVERDMHWKRKVENLEVALAKARLPMSDLHHKIDSAGECDPDCGACLRIAATARREALEEAAKELQEWFDVCYPEHGDLAHDAVATVRALAASDDTTGSGRERG